MVRNKGKHGGFFRTLQDFPPGFNLVRSAMKASDCCERT